MIIHFWTIFATEVQYCIWLEFNYMAVKPLKQMWHTIELHIQYR
jgi:hypothetical protein